MMPEPKPVRARSLVKRFGQFTAVDSIDLDINTGEVFGLLGPNGSGKTTTIRMLLGLLQASSGTIEVLGHSIIDDPEAARERVGYMSQRFSLYSDLTVMENLVFNGRAYGLPRSLLAKRIEEALDLSGLEGQERVRARDLSGGWRQRLALSAAVLHRPELVFLDEPTAGVDPVSRRAFWDLLYRLAASGTTVLVTTHYMDEAEHCHRLAFIRQGRIIACGPPQEIKRAILPGQMIEIAGDDPGSIVHALRRARQDEELPIQDVSLFGARVHVVSAQQDDVLPVLRRALDRSGLQAAELTVIEPSLEDVFVASMQRPGRLS